MEIPNSEILALAGTALSALIAAFSYRWKLQHEQRRSTRIVLYYLLEFHHWVYRTHLAVNHFPQEYLEQCKTLFLRKGLRIDNDQLTSMHIIITKGLRTLAIQEAIELKSRIADTYEKALSELAKDDPLLAFDLRGKDNIAALRGIFEKAGLSELVEDSFRLDLREATPPIQKLLENFEHLVSRDALEDSIRATAARCGLRIRVSTWKHLRRTRRVQKMTDISPEYAKTSERFLQDLLDEQMRVRATR